MAITIKLCAKHHPLGPQPLLLPVEKLRAYPQVSFPGFAPNFELALTVMLEQEGADPETACIAVRLKRIEDFAIEELPKAGGDRKPEDNL